MILIRESDSGIYHLFFFATVLRPSLLMHPGPIQPTSAPWRLCTLKGMDGKHGLLLLPLLPRDVVGFSSFSSFPLYFYFSLHFSLSISSFFFLSLFLSLSLSLSLCFFFPPSPVQPSARAAFTSPTRPGTDQLHGNEATGCPQSIHRRLPFPRTDSCLLHMAYPVTIRQHTAKQSQPDGQGPTTHFANTIPHVQMTWSCKKQPSPHTY